MNTQSTQPTPTQTALLDQLYAPIADELARVEERFQDELRSDFDYVNDLCRRARLYRGKMLRPSLLLLTGNACGRIVDAHLTLASVVEMVHLATLVHDDVLDVADMRRNQATINHVEGNEAAVLLGDYLISHAYHQCSSLGDQFAARRIAATTNTVCEGELMQIHHRGDTELTEQRYFEIIERKTASLTGTCCELGAHFAGCSPDEAEAWRCFGAGVGTAFQIVDDVLDMAGSEMRMGKTLGRDVDLGKATLPAIHAMRCAAEPIRRDLAAALGNGRHARRDQISEWLEACGSFDYALESAQGHIAQARAHLESVPPSNAKDALWAITEFILHRQH